MGKGRKRHTNKMKQRKGQQKKKDRIKKKIKASKNK